MHTLHPWHGAHYGDKAPQTVNAIIEIPQGSHTKYEVDKKTGLLKLDRIIYSSFHYPVNYGFIPQTLGQDNDPLDILVMCSESIQPLCLVEATVIGNMQMIDNGEIDDKIIAVATKDPGINFYTGVDQLPKHFIAVLRNYFEQYKVLENKKVVIDEFQDKEKAYAIIADAIALYKTAFPEMTIKNKPMDIQTVLIIILVGVAAGVLSGLVGVGGGIIIVPALIFFIGFSQKTAQGTSLAMIMLPVGIFGVLQYYKQGHVDFRIVGILAIGFLAGSFLGSKIALNISQEDLKKIFAILMIIIAIKMLFIDKPKKEIPDANVKDNPVENTVETSLKIKGTNDS